MGEEEGKEEKRPQATVEGNLEEVPTDNLLQEEESLSRKCPTCIESAPPLSAIEKAEIIQDLLRDYLSRKKVTKEIQYYFNSKFRAITNIIVGMEAVALFVENNRTDVRTTPVRTTPVRITPVRTSRDVFTNEGTPLVERRTTGDIGATPVSMGRKIEVPTDRGRTVEEPMRDEETQWSVVGKRRRRKKEGNKTTEKKLTFASVLASVPVSQKNDSTNTFITLKGVTEGWTMADIHKQLPTEEELQEIGVSAKVVRPLSDGKVVLVRTEGLVQANKILEWDRLKEQGLEARLTTSRPPPPDWRSREYPGTGYPCCRNCKAQDRKGRNSQHCAGSRECPIYLEIIVRQAKLTRYG
ncbi:unnamed protein product [Nezara viridula]|uniref:Uncharacterized protein n=1 Tax=Nezara viridula TaxID=85310 RepID=A0A9P0E599_NEZVI|nr:unnamed protein product [Nezara viridula]